MTALFILLTEVLRNPLSLNSPFPWIWFAPVLIALRYGVGCSQASVGLIVFAYLYKNRASIYDINFQLFVLGGFSLTVICAMFHGSWSKKINDSEALSLYLQRRIQSIADAYKLTSLSYRTLEQQYIVKPVTIRGSLQTLREMLIQSPLQTEVLTRFLTMLAMHCSLEIAAIFPVSHKRLLPKPITSIGNLKQPEQDDYLIQECLQTAEITFIKADEMLKGHVSDTLIAAPLTDQHGKLYAILVVQALPFLSLNDENIEIIRLLLQYFLEGNPVKNVALIIQQYPDCAEIFANELQRLTHLQQRLRHDSAVVGFQLLPHPHQNDYLFRLKQEHRGIDTVWETARGEIKFLLITMPITQQDGVENFRIRMGAILADEFQIALNKDKIKFKACQISAFPNPNNLIEDLLTLS